MDPQNKHDDLLIRYLLNETNAEEEAYVLNWINADEKNRLYVEELEKTIKLVAVKADTDKINVGQEWKQLQKALQNDQQQPASLYEYESDQEAISEDGRERSARIYKIIIRSAVAASLIFLVGLGWKLLTNRTCEDSGAQARVSEQQVNTDSLLTVVRHEVNTSGKTRQLTLPDGSEIALFTNSELTYKEPAGGNRREVYLKGKADFKVAKDKARPFTVFSEAVSTTALGTKFTVTAIEKQKHILVQLNEGKVVVKPVNGYNDQWKKDFYLLPGQELIYERNSGTARVRSFKINKAVSKRVNDSPLKENLAIPQNRKGSWFMFNNQPLYEIFDALEDMYDTKIIYSKKDVRNMYFIGTFDKSESLETILKQIATLNNLTITRENKTYRIKK
jgi:transmembrane sensor